MGLQLPGQLHTGGIVPDNVIGYISVESQGGTSVFKTNGVHKKAEPFRAEKKNLDRAIKAVESNGFTVLAHSRLGISVSGPADAYAALTGGEVRVVQRLKRFSATQERYASFLDIVGDDQPEACGLGYAASATAKIEGVVLETPLDYHGIFPSPIPPNSSKFHLSVPADIAIGLSATEAHRKGITGAGVKVAMVDSGQYPHPYFAAHRYNVLPTIAVVPGTSPIEDPAGHGTGESANIFAVAPGAELQAIRASNDAGRLVAAIAGFLKAKGESPAILTNSWGGNNFYPPLGGPPAHEVAFAAEVQDAIDSGVFVVFSAGNGQFWLIPQIADVLAAGGTFMASDLELQASNYASGYESPWVPGVTVPDVCGLVGMLPRAQYIMLPLPPECSIDQSASKTAPNDPTTDGTTGDDGWALFSGTSAAAPQIAGAAALILEAKPGLAPAQVHEALTESAVDVTTGACHPRFGNAAKVGHDSATGHGLVDASAAVQYAIDNF